MKMIVKYFLSFSFLLSSVYGAEKSDVGDVQQKRICRTFYNSERPIQWAFDALSHVGLRGDEHILDFGSGDGKLSSLMSFMVPRGSVTGVDITPAAIKFSQTMFPYTNLAFVQVNDINFSDFVTIHQYDVITAFSVFHLIPNPSCVLDNFKRIIKPNGKLVMTFPLIGNEDFYVALQEEMDKRGWETPVTTQNLKCKNLENIYQLVQESGFNVDMCQALLPESIFGSKREFVFWCVSNMAENLGIAREEAPRFFKAVIARYLSYNPEAEDEMGFIYFPGCVVTLIASPRSS